MDTAAGTGIFAIVFDHVAHITAVDLAPEMLNVAREKATSMHKNNIDFRIGDICNLEFDDKSFDTIVASNVLHLRFRPQLAMQEMRRVVRDNGKIIEPAFCHGTNLRSHILSRIFSLFGQKQGAGGVRKILKSS